MAPDQTALALLVFFGTATLKVYGCICYVGQEPVGATGNRYGWSLAEQRPCECTEFRLGGVNMKPQIKPYEVKIGGDNRVPIDKQGQIIPSPECREPGTTFEGTSLCATNTHRVKGSHMLELHLPMKSPIRLEFTAGIAEYVWVHFSPNGPDIEEALCKVDLGTKYAAIFKRESSEQSWTSVQSKHGVNYIEVPVMITYDNGRFEVAVQGVQDSTLTYNVTSPPQPSWFVIFRTSSLEVEWSFTEPCINDFNPQFTLW